MIYISEKISLVVAAHDKNLLPNFAAANRAPQPFTEDYELLDSSKMREIARNTEEVAGFLKRGGKEVVGIRDMEDSQGRFGFGRHCFQILSKLNTIVNLIPLFKIVCVLLKLLLKSVTVPSCSY